MSDYVELIDGDGHTIGWCRSISPEYDQGGYTVVQLDEYTPKCATKDLTLEGE